MRQRRSLRSPRLKYALTLAVLAGSTALCAPQSIAQNVSVSQVIERPDEDLQIFSLDMGKIRLFDALLVYEDLDTGRYYLPLTDFAEALEFPIRVDGDSLTADGWFMSEDRAFSLDMSVAKANVNGKDYTLQPIDIERHADGIYVSLEMLEQWFPVNLDVDFSELRLVVRSLEPLPIELRLEREKKREDIAKTKSRGRKKYPLAEIEAPLFTKPIINVNAQGILDNSDTAASRIVKSSTALVSSVVGGQDFHMSVNDSTANGQGPDIRASLSLIDLDSDLLGIGGTEYRLGDVYSNNIPYIASSSSGRGAYFSTFDAGYSDAGQSGTTRLRGDLPIGYQVDVMRNGQLLEFREEPDENGDYVFDLDVLPGLNVFELVFYGPQGQKEVKEERIFVPLNAAQKGDFDFKVNIVEDNRNLITNYNDSSSDPDYGKHRATIEAQYGLSDLSSVYASVSDVSMDGERERFSLLRFSRSFKSVRTDWSYARNFKSGSVLGVRFQSVFKGLSWQAEHSSYRNNFESEETDKSDISGILKHDTELRVSGAAPFLTNVPFTLKLQRLSNMSGNEKVLWSLRTTKNISKIRVTTEASQIFEENKDRQTDLSMQVSSRINRLNLRGGANFDIEPEYNLRNISFLADWKASDLATLRFGVDRTGIDENVVHNFTLGGSYEFDPAIMGVSVRYNDENELRAVLSSSFSLGYDPLDETVFMSKERLADTSALIPRVYYDKNNNGIRDDGDEWMKGIGFDGRGYGRKIRTDENGAALLSGIDDYERTTLKIDDGTLPDPFLVPAEEPKDYILRAGQVVEKDIPVVLVGEIDGEVLIAQNGRKEAAQSFLVDLVNIENADKTYQGKTEYDGFIWLQRIPMGTYKADINKQQLDDLGYCVRNTQNVTLTNEEPMASISEFILWPKLEGNVIVNLGRGSVSALQERWEALSSTLTRAFFDLNNYPASYILKGQGEEDATLVLYNMDEALARATCSALKVEEIFCKVWRMKEGYCPAGFVKIDQIEQDILAYNALEKSEPEDVDLKEGDLRDLTEDEVRKIIDN